MNEQKNNTDGQNICITQTHARYYAAGIIALLGFSFVAGYYWGKKRAYEEFLGRCSEDALGDKVSVALCSLYNASSDEQKEIDSDESSIKDGDANSIDTGNTSGGPHGISEKSEENTDETGAVGTNGGNDAVLYYARLAGFGSKRSADKYVLTLQGRGINAHVVTRTSKTTRGVTCTWHQVVTDLMSYDALQALVDGIKKIDKLYGVVLVENTK